MVYLAPEFKHPIIPENETYEGPDLDDGVRAVLPEGMIVKWVGTYRPSHWAVSSKIDAQLPNGSSQAYFLKVYTTKDSEGMAQGEYEGSKALYHALPEHIPRPIAAGALMGNPSRQFYLAEFRDMDDRLPEQEEELASVVVKLHQKTQSPNGKFGFHITTYGGSHPLNTSWLVQGPDEELDRLAPLILDRVIPALLRPLESDGERKLKPVLIHGDLWHGNGAVDKRTHKPVIFDPCAFYGHNEFEFAPWRALRYLTGREHMRAYRRLTGESEDEDEARDDRHALYALLRKYAADLQTARLASLDHLA
ncbi:kinase-like domain-containing protein [Xylariaceae sp. FL0594]|nr:kinase-like domain-containing protein [Xylariaceae sp. FL0594]